MKSSDRTSYEMGSHLSTPIEDPRPCNCFTCRSLRILTFGLIDPTTIAYQIMYHPGPHQRSVLFADKDIYTSRKQNEFSKLNSSVRNGTSRI